MSFPSRIVVRDKLQRECTFFLFVTEQKRVIMFLYSRFALLRKRRWEMKRESILVLTMVVLLAASAFAGTYSGGTGEPNNPYLISDANDMNEIGANPDDWDAHFLLVADINLADYTGTKFNIIGNPYTPHFTGDFDGNDYIISNFTYTSPDANFIGLFACVGNNGKVKQLVMQNVNTSGNWFTAGLVGMNFGKICDCDITGTISGKKCTGGLVGGNFGTISDCSGVFNVQGDNETGGLAGDNHGMISDCYAEGEVSGCDETSGLAGENHGTISNCYATGEVLGNSYSTGGLVGDNHGTILACYATCSVDGNFVTGGLVGENFGLISWSYATDEVSGDSYNTGGLVGINSHGTVSYCYATGNIDANNGVGGLVGWNVNGTISNSYSTSSVLGNKLIGGLVGDNGHGTISNCYSAGVVDGNDDTGGLIGGDHDGTITNCFWDTESSGQSSSDGPEVGKSTADMKKESTFTNWDFVEIWNIGENQTYLYLRVYPAGDLNHDRSVNMFDFAILASHWLEGAEP